MIMKVKRILWPTDLSENSYKALPYITSLSESYGAEIHVLCRMLLSGAFGYACRELGFGDAREEDQEHGASFQQNKRGRGRCD